MAPFVFHCPMRWSDMDAYGHVHNVQFLTYLEEARLDMLQDVIARAKADDGPEAGLLVASSEIVYKHPLVHRHAPVPIEVSVTKIGGAYFDLAYEVSDEASTSGTSGTSGTAATVYARASSRLVTYDFAAARPRRVRPHERAFLEAYLVGAPPRSATAPPSASAPLPDLSPG